MNEEINCKEEKGLGKEGKEENIGKNDAGVNKERPEGKESNQDNTEKKDTVELEDEIIADMLEEKVDSLKEQLKEVESEKESIYKKAQRLKADFVNFRKRTAKEKMAIGIQAKIEVFCEILPVLDNFERALNIDSDDKEFKKGIEMIYKQLINTLKQEGLTKIAAVGEEFDHKYHEAVCQVEDCEQESGIIVEEIEKGYLCEDKIVRPAKVKVAK